MYPDTVTSNEDMMEALGIDLEYERMIPGLLDEMDLTIGSSGGGFLDRVDFQINEAAGSQWSLSYTRRLEGSEIISGL
jgi:hypothetical protein